MSKFVVLSLMSGILSVAVLTDLRRHRIPNQLVVIGLLLGLITQLVVNGPRELGLGILGALLGLACFMPFYALRAMGAGDVKLMAVVGLFMGPRGLLYAVALSLIAGGVCAIGYLAWRMVRASVKSFWEDGVNAGAVTAVIAGRIARRDRLPFALPIAVGSLSAVWIQGLTMKELAAWL